MRALDRNLGDYLFYGSLAIFVSLTFISNIDSVASFVPVFSYAALVLLVLGFVFRIRQYKAIEVIFLCALASIGLYQFVWRGDNSLIKFVLLLAALKGIPFRECISFDFKLRVALTVLLIFLSIAGVAQDVSFDDASRGSRHSYGFSNSNQLGMAIFIECLEYLYLKDFKPKVVSLIGIALVAFWADFATGSRSSTMLIIVALVISLIVSFREIDFRKMNFLRNLIAISAPLLFVVTWVCWCSYHEGAIWAISLNQAMTNRLMNVDVFCSQLSFGLFGSDVSLPGITLDTAYAYLLFGYGIVVTVLYLVAFPSLIANLWRRGEYGLTFVLGLLAVYGLFERLWLCPEYDALILSFAALLYGSSCKMRSIGLRAGA